MLSSSYSFWGDLGIAEENGFWPKEQKKYKY
jgi:hypothetical protein